eukprot:5341053-Amphidinium_carterae.1
MHPKWKACLQHYSGKEVDASASWILGGTNEPCRFARTFALDDREVQHSLYWSPHASYHGRAGFEGLQSRQRNEMQILVAKVSWMAQDGRSNMMIELLEEVNTDADDETGFTAPRVCSSPAAPMEVICIETCIAMNPWWPRMGFARRRCPTLDPNLCHAWRPSSFVPWTLKENTSINTALIREGKGTHDALAAQEMHALHDVPVGEKVFEGTWDEMLEGARELHASGQLFENKKGNDVEEDNPDEATALFDEPEAGDDNDSVISTKPADEKEQTHLRDPAVDWLEPPTLVDEAVAELAPLETLPVEAVTTSQRMSRFLEMRLVYGTASASDLAKAAPPSV